MEIGKWKDRENKRNDDDRGERMADGELLRKEEVIYVYEEQNMLNVSEKVTHRERGGGIRKKDVHTLGMADEHGKAQRARDRKRERKRERERE